MITSNGPTKVYANGIYLGETAGFSLKEQIIAALERLGVTHAGRGYFDGSGSDRRWSMTDLATDLADELAGADCGSRVAVEPAATPASDPAKVTCGYGELKFHFSVLDEPLCKEQQELWRKMMDDGPACSSSPAPPTIAWTEISPSLYKSTDGKYQLFRRKVTVGRAPDDPRPSDVISEWHVTGPGFTGDAITLGLAKQLAERHYADFGRKE